MGEVPWDEDRGEADVEFPVFAAEVLVCVGGDETTHDAKEDIEDNHHRTQGTTITW